MKYHKKKLFIENISVENIAKKYGTPAYCYSYKLLKENILKFKKNFKAFSPIICFAVKANTNLNLLKEIKKFGLGADVVSMGELMTATKAGINPKRLFFLGSVKPLKKLLCNWKKNFLINAESENEVREIDRIAKLKKQKVQIGVRLNPNTDAKTLSQISTGKKENKFGVNNNTLKKS